MTPPLWDQPSCDDASAAGLAQALGVSPILGRLLRLRGVASAEEGARFLAPTLDHLHDPFLMADMDRAVERLRAAIARRDRIVVHGDYDVDGISATVILRRALERLGADVGHFIPDRLRDGYGLLPATVDRLAAEGARLIVSVDCGIRGIDAALRARALGVDLIITDHHEPGRDLPDAVAVINPKRPDCRYPEKDLAGAGVALKLVQALCRREGREAWLPAFVKIASLGTLGDVVPLLGENRVIARIGLDLLSRGPNKVGLRALIDVAGLAGRRLDSHHVSFLLAPRLNAAGRMSTPDLAARLLLADDESMAGEVGGLARQLDEENQRRQREEQEIVAAARKQVDGDPDVGAHALLVVTGQGWHRGVIGIVASKLVDAYHRPAIVISVDGEVAHGSCRSIPSLDMLGALERAGHLLTRFGGHRLAAGLVIEPGRIREFRRAVTAVANDLLGPDDLRPRIRIDGTLAFDEITERAVEEVARLEPHGPGNPRPVFRASGVEVVDGPRRIKQRHLTLGLRQRGRIFRAMAWRAADQESKYLANRRGLDLAFSLAQNTWRGQTTTELTVVDGRPGDRGD